MKTPLSYRKSIALYYAKSAEEYRQDPYERYDPMVIRQTGLHLADELWGRYPMQSVLDYAATFIDPASRHNICEIGCGVGRWIGELAKAHPTANCYGIDYSYQMLKRANEYWIEGKTIEIDLSKQGHEVILSQGHSLSNLAFGLAKAEELPFDDDSQDLILSSFLIDRVADPAAVLSEMYRVLCPGGRIIMISPLNFQTTDSWRLLYPIENFQKLVTDTGFELIDWTEEMLIKEPLDIHGNHISWHCVAFVGEKKSQRKKATLPSGE